MATAIRSVMSYVMTSPQVYTTFQAEIGNAIRDGKISRPRVEAHALQAVILEGLRMYPPARGLLSKVVFVPGGSEIAANTWSIMRNPDIFGQAPDFILP